MLAFVACSAFLVACRPQQGAKSPATPAADSKAAVVETTGPRTVEVACAGCVFGMEGAKGCQLAAKIDGKVLLVSGVNMRPHDSGLCEASRMAEVSGAVEGERYVAASFALKP
ncbi:MAG: DUF6370 family protein [Planctomycetota bacterium]